MLLLFDVTKSAKNTMTAAKSREIHPCRNWRLNLALSFQLPPWLRPLGPRALPWPALEEDLRDHRLVADFAVETGKVDKIRSRTHAHLGRERRIQVR